MAQKFSCNDCGFEVRSDDENELVDMVQKHGEEKHDRSVSENDVRQGMEST